MELTKKQFKFQGKTIEELQQLDVREFAKLIRSRQRRTALRNFNDIENFVNRARKKINKNKSVKTHKRYLTVVPAMVGMKIHIHSGNKFVPIEITGEMLGHTLGEFAPTRTKASHTKTGVGGTKGTRAKSKH